MIAPYSPKTAIEFIRYCRFYDPFITVDDHVIRTINKIQEDPDSWIEGIPGQILTSELGVSPQKIKTYFRCEEILGTSHRNIPRRQIKIPSRIIKNQHFENRIYIYYELEDTTFQWVIIKSLENKFGSYYYSWGCGETLSDAEQNLMCKYADALKQREQEIRWCLTNNVPINSDDFIIVAQRYNLNFQENQVKFKSNSGSRASLTFTSYSISGKTKGAEYKVKVNLEDFEATWTIERYLPVEIYVHGDSFEEVIRQHDEEYKRLQATVESWDEAVKSAKSRAANRSKEEEDNVLGQQGQAHLEWLESEFGDNF